MSRRLDQQDSYATHFTSTITAVRGNQVSLAESLFYPNSGGQPHDTGTLNGIQVTNVLKDKDGETVWHTLAGSLPLGARVRGVIDWPRRYRHMQRHSAQHLLSQAFVRLDRRFSTEAVSLTHPECTIDLAGQPDEAAMAEAEARASEVIYRALPIKSFAVDAGELARYPLRRPPKVSGRVRLVQIGDFDLSACGGTHVRTSAEAGPIKLLGYERIRRGLTRIRFICGHEALADYRDKHAQLTALTRQLSCSWRELEARLERLQASLKQQQQAADYWQKQAAHQRAEALLADAQTTPRGKLVRCILPEAEAALLPHLAAELVQSVEVIALLASRSKGQAKLLYACGASVTLDMRALLQASLPAIGGHGGGSAERAQGGGSAKGLTQALALAEAAVMGATP
jgi:alanyl-tRNA synthetase